MTNLAKGRGGGSLIVKNVWFVNSSSENKGPTSILSEVEGFIMDWNVPTLVLFVVKMRDAMVQLSWKEMNV